MADNKDNRGGLSGWPKPLEISLNDWEDLLDEPTVEIKLEPESKCTCGGLKTYQSFAPCYHSDWCEYGGKSD